MTNAYDKPAISAGVDMEKGMGYEKKTVQYLLNAADLMADDSQSQKAELYIQAGERAVTYDRNQACSLWKKALNTNTDYLNDQIKANQEQWGCK